MNCPDCRIEDGEYCDRGPADCPNQRAAALDAGIPADVIDGKATLIINCVACFAPCMGGLRLRLAPNRSICTDCADLERDSVIE